MKESVVTLKKTNSNIPLDVTAILNALPSAILVLNNENIITYLNMMGEQFLQGSVGQLENQHLNKFVPPDSPLFSLIEQVRTLGNEVFEYGVPLESPRIGKHLVDIQASSLPEMPGFVVLSLQERTIAAKIDRQLTHRSAARSITAMSSVLAHEVKNPLSGIRGAAQLLEQSVNEADMPLTLLIREEADRICALVDRMGTFSDGAPLQGKAVNIHRVLDRVVKLSKNGFGRHLRFIEHYDPSLPPVLGDRDLLVQIFLNLLKNAAEAAPETNGEITLITAYKHGVRFAVPGSDTRVHLPLMVSIQDNGEGIPENIQPHLFDPFVTSKQNGSGLGLALVAKIIDDHGGVIEFESEPRKTIFKIMLPMADQPICRLLNHDI
jgi:two-component system, NtrC family, nitrogen regulation sensor histidine kinase GlnL